MEDNKLREYTKHGLRQHDHTKKRLKRKREKKILYLFDRESNNGGNGYR